MENLDVQVSPWLIPEHVIEILAPRHNFEDACAKQEQPSAWTTILGWQRVIFDFSSLKLIFLLNSHMACCLVFAIMCVQLDWL